MFTGSPVFHWYLGKHCIPKILTVQEIREINFSHYLAQWFPAHFGLWTPEITQCLLVAPLDKFNAFLGLFPLKDLKALKGKINIV